MPLSPDHILCRFIKPEKEKWNDKLNQPTQRAFKQPDMSVWNQDLLRGKGACLEDLLFGELLGYGQAHHQVEDYYRLAEDVEGEGISCRISIQLAPDQVPFPWLDWQYAHFQVYRLGESKELPLELRRRLAAECRKIVAPQG